mgnify:CR=1 FL=1
MSSWRDAILNDFVPHVSKLTLVADPDALLTEEKLALELRNRSFDSIEFNDPVEFRYANLKATEKTPGTVVKTSLVPAEKFTSASALLEASTVTRESTLELAHLARARSLHREAVLTRDSVPDRAQAKRRERGR